MTGMALGAIEMVESTSHPAFATNERGEIFAWNGAAERILGYPRSRIQGRRCYDVLQGLDLFGNRFCDDHCPLLNMARHHEVAHPFQLDVRNASGEPVRVVVASAPLPGAGPGQLYMLHVLQRQAPEREDRPLTERELEVLGLVAEGRGTREIATTLGLSLATVRNHVQHVLRKLDAHSKLEAVAVARRRRLL